MSWLLGLLIGTVFVVLPGLLLVHFEIEPEEADPSYDGRHEQR